MEPAAALKPKGGKNKTKAVSPETSPSTAVPMNKVGRSVAMIRVDLDLDDGSRSRGSLRAPGLDLSLTRSHHHFYRRAPP